MNINVHKHILLVSSYFTSANTNIMLDIIRIVHPNSIIHLIASDFFPYQFNASDVITYPISSRRQKFQYVLSRIKKLKFITRPLNFCIYHISHILDHFIPNEYERKSYLLANQLVQEYPISEVFTVCYPFYAHNVGYKLSQNKKINWFTIWLDSYSNGEAKSNFIWNKVATHYENKIFNATKQIYAIRGTFTGNTIIDKFRQKLSYIGIPYLDDKSVAKLNNDIIYAGSIGGIDRNPHQLMNLLVKSLDFIPEDLTFKFYVNYPKELQKYEKLSNGRIRVFGYVSIDELDTLLSNSYMLITLGNACSFQLSSKIIQSISYRKPILFFYTQEKDISFEYFNDYPDLCAINLNDDINKSIKSLANYFSKQHSQIEYIELIRSKRLKECTPDSLKDCFQKSELK